MLDNNVGSAMHTIHTNRSKGGKPAKIKPKRKKAKAEYELKARNWKRWKRTFNLNKPDLVTYYPDRAKKKDENN